MKIRNLFLPLIAMAFLSACGDDVTVVEPPEPVYGIRSVTVTPNNVTLEVNKTLQMVAAVVTDPGAPSVPTVAWSSSDPAVATVSGVGLVSSKAKGAVAVTATATLGTSSAAGSATLTVTQEVIAPATVSINSVTNANGTPADLSNIVGTINVKLNLDRGGEQVTKVQLLADGVVVSEQTFGSSLVDAALAASLVEEINMPWNTTTYNATTGQVSYLNGPHTLSAKVVSVQNTSGTASPSVKLTLANADMFTGTLAGALSANTTVGTKWSGGDIRSNLVYVGYSGKKVANASGWILGGGGQGAFTNVVPTTGQTWVLTLVDATFAAYSSAAPEGTFVNGVVYTDGSTAGGFGVITNKILVDNTPPTNAPVAIRVPVAVDNFNVAGAWGSNWLNGTTPFSTFNATADADVGGVSSKFYYIAGSLPATACDVTGMTLAAGSPPSTTLTTYRAKVVTSDALQNVACANMHGGNLFGVDIVNPTFSVTVGSPLNGEGFVAAPPTVLSVLDNAAGFTATPLGLQLLRATVAAGTSTFDVAVFDNSPSTLNLYRAINTVFPSTDGTDGYWQRKMQVLDQAGNTADAGTAVYLEDPIPATVIIEQAPIAVGNTTTFQVVVNDNVDLKDMYGVVGWAGYGFRYPVQNIGAFGLPYLVGNQTVPYVANNFVRCFGGYTAVGTPVATFTSRVRDFVQAAYTTGAGVGISSAVVGACTAPFSTVGLTGSSFGQVVSPTTVVVALTGTAATSPSFSDPFARVELWVETGAVTNEYTLVGTAAGGVLSTTTTSRTYTWSFTYSVPSGRRVFAVGVTAAGMGAKIADDLMP